MIAEDQKIYSAFLQRLQVAPQRILMLDYDGTLAPFRVNRDQAFPYPEVPAIVAKVMAVGTRVILISGRAARELMLLSGIQPHPEIWGSHGLERLKTDGRYEVVKLPELQQRGLSLAAQGLLADGDGNGRPGRLELHTELKPGGIAIHWRGMESSEIENLRAEAMRAWNPLLQDYQLYILPFDGGMEIRAIGRDKGSAVNEILKDADPDASAAYLGDDRTDEDAFRALKGKGLSVLVRAEHRATAADLWLKPPGELLQFLEDWLLACGGTA